MRKVENYEVGGGLFEKARGKNIQSDIIIYLLLLVHRLASFYTHIYIYDHGR